MKFSPTVQRWINSSWIQTPMLIAKRFGDDNAGLFAAGLAFFMLLTFAPLILTGVAALGFFVSPDQAQATVQKLVQNMVPSGGAQQELSHFFSDRLNVSGQVDAIIRGRTLAGILGLLTLIWTSMQIFVNASTAMNAAFEVKESRSWIRLRIVAFALLAASGILITVTIVLSAVPTAIAHFRLPLLDRLPVPFFIVETVTEVVAVLLNTLLYLVIYKYLPSADVPWRSAFAGGLTASVFWEVAKKGLSAYILKPNASIYGGLADLILFVLWIYYSMMILLLGAEIAAHHQKRGPKSPHIHLAAFSEHKSKGVSAKESRITNPRMNR